MPEPLQRAVAAETDTNSSEMNIWYREDSSSEKHGPFTQAVLQTWYDSSLIIPTAEFSTDNAMNWISIIEFRCRNGPLLPFGTIGKRGNPFASVVNLHDMVVAERADVVRLEREVESLLSDLHEQELSLKTLREMEDILHSRESDGQITGRTEDFAAVAETLDNEGTDREEIAEAGCNEKANAAVNAGPEPAFVLEQEPKHEPDSCKNPEKLRYADPFALLRSADADENPYPVNDRYHLQQIWYAFKEKVMSGTKFDRDTKWLFTERHYVCELCKRCTIRKASALFGHLNSNGHWDQIVAQKATISKDAVDFWLSTFEGNGSKR